MRVYPNPTVEPFNEARFYRPGEALTINGNNLNVGASERDIKITVAHSSTLFLKLNIQVGGEDCPLTAMANKVITCSPPEKKPELAGGLDPEIVVKIGGVR